MSGRGEPDAGRGRLAEARLVSHIVGRCELGPAWAGNTANTAIFRHHGVLTHDGRQYVAYYQDRQTLVVGLRDLTSGRLTQTQIEGRFNLDDAHNTISIGLDRRGILHLCYDQHGSRIRYRRGLDPHAIERFSDEIPMTGTCEGRLTYPTFFSSKDLSRLFFLYRDGRYNNGAARLKSYDEATQSWVDLPEAILSGCLHKPWTSNAYWNSPLIDSDGKIHLSFVWRTDAIGGTLGLINNSNISYASSSDLGQSWETSKGLPLQLPLTQVNAETVWAVSPGSNLINQCGMTVDRFNNPHIVYYANDDNGIVQYHHLWFDGKRWTNNVISSRQDRFVLRGGGTLQTPLSRPDILIDREANAYVLFRSEETNNRFAVTALRYPDYRYEPGNTRIVIDMNVGWSEPVVDRERWSQSNILTLYVQHSNQPNGDLNVEDRQAPAYLYDLVIAFASDRKDLLATKPSTMADQLDMPQKEGQISPRILEARINDWHRMSYGRTKKAVVYTAILENSITLKVPEYLNPDWDYVCFSDQADYPGNHPWQIRPISYVDTDPAQSVTYLRVNPDQFLGDYEFSIWIEPCLLIKDHFLDTFLRQFEANGFDIAAPRHPLRCCIYVEMAERLKTEGNASAIERQMNRYREKGLPENFGMIEQDILVRRHGAATVRNFARVWWSEICAGSMGDHLPVMYALYAADLSWCPLFGPGASSRTHPSFTFFKPESDEPGQLPAYSVPRFLPASYVGGSQPYWRRLPPEFNTAELDPFREIPVDIVASIDGAPDQVRKCLQALIEHALPVHKIVLIGEVADNEISAFLSQKAELNPWLRIVRHEYIKDYLCKSEPSACIPPFVVFLSGNTIVSSNWVLKMWQVATSAPNIGLVGTMSNLTLSRHAPATAGLLSGWAAPAPLPNGFSVEDMNRLCQRYGYTSLFPVIPFIDGRCRGIRRAVFDAIGNLEIARLMSHHIQADELAIRASDAGFLQTVATHCFVAHMGSDGFGLSTPSCLPSPEHEALRGWRMSDRVARATATMAANPILGALCDNVMTAAGLSVSGTGPHTPACTNRALG